MRPLDLVKATVVCGMIAFLVFSYPALGQTIIITVLSLLWLSYLYRTITNVRAK